MKRIFGMGVLGMLVFFASFGCKKKIKCDDAQLCIRNNSADTVFYCWGCNQYEDFIPPGGTGCTNVGYVSYDPNSGSGSLITTYFNSSAGDYAIEVSDCYVEKVIE